MKPVPGAGEGRKSFRKGKVSERQAGMAGNVREGKRNEAPETGTKRKS